MIKTYRPQSTQPRAQPPLPCPDPFRALIVGALTLLSGFVTLSAADMTPITVTGFNRDVVIESTASGPPYIGAAVELNPNENLAFYQVGLPGKSFGLPASGSFLSAVGDNTTFQFQSYSGNNTLVFNALTGLSEGTLTLVSPDTYGRIAILANSASGGGSATLTINFSDGTSYVTTYSAPDWFNNAGFALQGTERINLTTGATTGAPTNPRFYQTSLDLTALLGAGNKPISSLTFGKVASANSTAVYAISGEIAQPSPATILVNPTNTTVVETSTVTFNAAAGGVPSPSLRWLRNGLTISGATNANYSFVATLADHNATYRLVASNVANSIRYVVTSSPAILTVIADPNRPVLLSAQSLGLNQVLARFSERLKLNTATNLANYSLNGGISISTLTLDDSQSNVVLNVSTMADNVSYTLTVNNVAD